ncbi:hypothetical protein H8A95_15990 [Bradyrhizobium sp. Pear76]|uniref:hypothetical protein n=1 Tax=Bradyrhizobium oropedii TaxID=1571201 RepID=UPI001E2D6659|nr:hypothetical protein [Bradyrhizobium oropedii]MCC8963772.1 hypothetical protein [Bradyrhizobium oropedii]
MKKTILAVLAALSLPAVALAQVAQTFVPLGFCALTPDAGAGLASCAGGIPSGARSATIAVETQAIRYRDDGTAPTSTVGMPVAVGQTIVYQGTLSKIQLISQTAGAKVSVLFYR